MPGYRSEHVKETLKREIISIVRRLNDPRVVNNFFDIVKTDISGDMSVYSVYISAVSGFDKAVESSEGLNSASAYIKRELANGIGKSLRLRRIPDIKFIPTDAVEYGVNMITKINDVCKLEE